MGARPSRRRLPPPPELLVRPPRATVTQSWRDPVDGPCVWLLQLARDCSAEGRALYAWARRCPAGHDELPPCALARFSLECLISCRVVFYRRFRGWGVEHGGNGWAVEKNLTVVPGAPSRTCFVTSFEGVAQRGWDLLQPPGDRARWKRGREECDGRLWVRLLDECENEVVKFSASPNPVLQRAESSCRQVSHVFTDFGKGIRYVSFEQYGRDTRSVRVRIRLS
uniref:F-box protein 17 n=1 Tax=Cricetulus griseus TaxID=10029 RepID=A0A8C2MSC3_CRIGR